ncbi:MAG: MFS transporter [Planctomycetota bacterium]|nr:MFS transporter [Planctomycetota bacterium]
MREHDSEENTAASTAFLVAWMWVAYFLNYCDRQAVFAMFKVLKTDLSMSETQLGLTGALFLWVYGIGCPIAGFLADRFSKKKLIIGSLIVWSLVTIATGLSVSATMLLAMRAAMGVSEALFMPAAISMTTNSTVPKWRSRAVASLTTAQIAGVIAGASFGGWMAQQGHWRMAFILLGLCGLAYAAPFAWYLSRLPIGADRNETAEDLRSDLAYFETNSRPSLLSIFQVPTFCILCAAFPLFVFGLWMIYSWLANYIEEKFELSTAQAAWISTAYLQLATIFGLFAGGYIADRFRKKYRSARMTVLLASVGCCAPLLVAIGQVENLDLLKFILVAYGFFSGWMIGNIFPAAFEVVGSSRRGLAVGILNFFGAALSGFAPLMVGTWKKSYGLPGMLGVAGIAYALAAILLALAIIFTLPKDQDANASTSANR